MYKAVFSDLGETLVGFTPRTYEVVYNILMESGYELDKKRVYRAYAKVVTSNLYPGSNGTDMLDIRDLLYELNIYPKESLIRKFDGSLKSEETKFLYDDAIDFLEGVKSLGLTLVLVSNATPRALSTVKEFKLDKYFDKMIFSFEVGLIKPNPRIFSKAIDFAGDRAVHI
ncbi:HAD family hydrolase, partial [Acidianus sp. RZ1]